MKIVKRERKKTDNRPRNLFLGGYLYDKGENDERCYVSREFSQPIYKYILSRLFSIVTRLKAFF